MQHTPLAVEPAGQPHGPLGRELWREIQGLAVDVRRRECSCAASVLIDKFGSFWPDKLEVRMAKGKASKIELSAEERRELESLARRRSTGQALALRSRIVLAAGEGVHNGLIAERLGIFRGTVGKW